MFVMRGPGRLSQHIDLQPTGRSGNRIPVGGEIFRTRPDPASYTMGTGYHSRG